MLEIVSSFLLFAITYLVDCLIFKKIMKSKVKVISLKNMSLIIFMSIIASFIDVNYTDVAKMVISNIQSCILLKLVFDTSLIRTIIFTIIIFLISAVAEIIFTFIFIILFGIDAKFFTDTLHGEILCNIGIIIIYWLMFQIKFIYKFTGWMISFYKSNSKKESAFLLIFIVILIASITYPIIINAHSVRELVTFTLIFIAAIYFIMNFFKQRSKNGELKKEYDSLLQYMSEYEKALDEKSKRQHEYRNQLVMIKDMVSGKNKKASQYIQELLNEEETKNVDLLNSLRFLPAGGIKGLIYYKAEKMIEEGMEVHINIAKSLEKKKVWKTCVEELQDVSRVIGVYIDNAIEAARKAEKKYVIIDFEYEEDKLIISFSNTYKGHIQLDKLDKQGYSTKGKNRGYGLPLVKEIIDKNELLSQEREMNGMFYVQKLIIKNK